MFIVTFLHLLVLFIDLFFPLCSFHEEYSCYGDGVSQRQLCSCEPAGMQGRARYHPKVP